MKFRSYIKNVSFLILHVLFVTSISNAQSPINFPESFIEIPLRQWNYISYDDSTNALPSKDFSDWKPILNSTFRTEVKGIQWISVKINIQTSYDHSLLFRITQLQSAYEIYWDGKIIGYNGSISDEKAKEIPGNNSHAVYISPANSKQGIHSLAIRFSNYHSKTSVNKFAARLDKRIYDYQYRTFYLFKTLVFVGICLTATIFGIVMFLGGGRFKHYLYFSLIVFPVFFSKAMAFYIGYFNPVSSWALILFILQPYAVYVSYFFIIIFFIYIFDFKKKIIFPAILFLLIVSNEIWQYDNLYLTIALIILFIIIPVLALIKGKNGSMIALISIFLFVCVDIIYVFGYQLQALYFDISYYLFVLSLMFLAGKLVKNQVGLQKSLELRNIKLESDLLKKLIQPHFLMNTMASLQSWVRKDPKKAEKFIQSISDEFRIITQVSTQKSILLQNELELCNYHLEIMGYRRDAKYNFIIESDIPSIEIPPLIIHTLIENGITHAFKPREDGTFWFSATEDTRKIILKVKNDGSQIGLIKKMEKNDIEEGTGLKYIKANMEDAMPGNWQINYGIKDNIWEVEIIINKQTSK